MEQIPCKVCDGVGQRIIPRGGHLAACTACQGSGEQERPEVKTSEIVLVEGPSAKDWVRQEVARIREQEANEAARLLTTGSAWPEDWTEC